MPKYSYKEFAALVGLDVKHIGTYVKRGKIVANKATKTIDSFNEINKLLIEKRKNKVTEHQVVEHIAKHAAPNESSEDGDLHLQAGSPEDEIPAYSESERRLKYLDTLKRKREISLLKIKEEKISGELIPSALLGPVLLQHNKSLLDSFHTGAQQVVARFAHKHGINQADVVAMRKDIVEISNEAMKRAVAITNAQLKAIVDEYCISRAQGEKK